MTHASLKHRNLKHISLTLNEVFINKNEIATIFSNYLIIYQFQIFQQIKSNHHKAVQFYKKNFTLLIL